MHPPSTTPSFPGLPSPFSTLQTALQHLAPFFLPSKEDGPSGPPNCLVAVGQNIPKIFKSKPRKKRREVPAPTKCVLCACVVHHTKLILARHNRRLIYAQVGLSRACTRLVVAVHVACCPSASPPTQRDLLMLLALLPVYWWRKADQVDRD